MIKLNWLLILSGVLFAISVAGLCINRKCVIVGLVGVVLGVLGGRVGGAGAGR